MTFALGRARSRGRSVGHEGLLQSQTYVCLGHHDTTIHGILVRHEYDAHGNHRIVVSGRESPWVARDMAAQLNYPASGGHIAAFSYTVENGLPSVFLYFK